MAALAVGNIEVCMPFLTSSYQCIHLTHIPQILYTSLTCSCKNHKSVMRSRPGAHRNETQRELAHLASVSGISESWTSCLPLSSKFGTHKPVNARIRPWLEPFSVRTSLKHFKLFHLSTPGEFIEVSGRHERDVHVLPCK